MSKLKRIYFKCPPHLLHHLDQQAAKYYEGNRSEFLRYLILEDMRLGGRPLLIPSDNRKKTGEGAIPTASHGGPVLNELKDNALFQKIKQQPHED